MHLRRLTLLLPVVFSAVLAGCPDDPENVTPDAGSEDFPSPQLTAVSPTAGPLTGGTQVLLTGENFREGATIRFGDAEATEVVVSTARRISAKTPARGSAGSVTVEVRNPDGQAAALPNAFVYEGTVGPSISDAKLLGDARVRDQSGNDTVSHKVFAQVRSSGVTEGEGAGAGVRAQVGFAEDTSSLALSQLTWTDAAFDHDLEDGDVYLGSVQVPGATGDEVKVYALAARFSLDDGKTWTVADLDGSANGTQLAQLQRLEVSRNRVDWCRLGGQTQEAPPNLSLSSGQMGPLVFVQLWEPGVTTGTGAGEGIEAQLGVGPLQSDPRSDGTWSWDGGEFNVDTGNGSDDEFRSALVNPGEGSFSFAWRVRIDGGPWRYCDADGSGAMSTEFELEQMGRVTVTPAAAEIDRCQLQFPATLTTSESAPSAPVYGRVWAQGYTDAAGQGGGITGEVGYGPVGSTPSDTWTWSQTNFNVDADNGAADEYAGTILGPPAGAYHYAYRFRLGGGDWTYCDLDGSDTGGYSSAQAGVLTALPPQATCRLIDVRQPGTSQPVSAIASGDPLEARAGVLIPGITAQPGAAANVTAQFGVGTEGTDASTATGWGWTAASFSSDDATTGEDVWGASFNAAYSGNRAVAFRYSTDDGTTWTYCDRDGSANGYQPTQQHALTVTKHGELDYCNLQWPPNATNGDTIYAQVYENGTTPSANAMTAETNFEVQLGWGREVEDPGLAWTWSAAAFNVVQGNNDEFSATLSGLPSGTWSYTMRFRRRPSGGWCYGDFDGNGSGVSLNGFNGQNSAGGPNLGQATVAP